MIIVKEYDQMDSLRELLTKGARKYIDTEEKVQLDGTEDILEEEPVLCTPKRGLRATKRRRDEEEEVPNDDDPAQQDAKRRRTAANHNEVGKLSNEKPLALTKCVQTGKENIPPPPEEVSVGSCAI